MLPLIGMLGGANGGGALAAQAVSSGLVALAEDGAVSSGISAAGGIISFAKAGNEILSGYPFYYSNDNGTSFASQAVDIPSSSGYTKVETDGTKWAAIRGDFTTGGSVYRSTNRANWTVQALTNNTITYWIAYGSGRWAITGTDSSTGQGALWYSTDLISFTKTAGGLSGGFSGGHLAYGHARFMTADPGTGYIERAAASSLSSWSRVALPAVAGGGAKMAYSTVHSRWVHIGVSGGLFVAAYSNNDGAAWTAATVPSPTFTMGTIESVVALPGGGFIAVGKTAGSLGAAIYSVDGTEWVNIPDAEDFQGLYGLVAL